MKTLAFISLMMICASSTALAHGRGYYSGYDAVDAMANQEIAAISAREQAEVMHELREGDYQEAQEVIWQEEALKNEIRREEAMYDNARDMNRFNMGYSGYYGYPRW